MEYDSPKPQSGVKFGIKYLRKKTPKIAKRLSAAFGAVAAYGMVTPMLPEGAQLPEAINTICIACGLAGAFISHLFGEVK